MDPVSVMLAIISFATAIKDLVELGQKIHESFAKVSKHLRNAQRVAGNIKEMVDEINAFCERHQDELANMEDFGLALEGLLGKFRNFEALILPLLPKIGRRKLGAFKDLIRGWWNNEKIQESISNLESDIVKVMRGYMMVSTMRIEAKQGTNHQETIRGLTGIAQDLAIVHRGVSMLPTTTVAAAVIHHLDESSGTTNDEFTRNVIMFAQSTLSTSAPMLRTPNLITEELMTVAYIKLQINSIAMIVEKMSMSPMSAPNKIALNSVEKFNLPVSLDYDSMSITHIRHDTVRRITTLCDLLDTPSIHIISIKDGANGLDKLSRALGILRMDHESILLGNWATRLSRMLVGASGGLPNWRANLALCLYNQSIQYSTSSNQIRSLQAIEEAYAITQDLWDSHGEETHFQMLYSTVLLQYATLVDNQQSIKLVVEAIQILEGILNVQAFILANGRIQTMQLPMSSCFDHLFSSTIQTSAICDYATALQDLGHYIAKTDPGSYQSALALMHLAIALHKKMGSIYGDVYKAELGKALLLLMQSKAASCMHTQELVDIADECIQLFRQLTENNPMHFVRGLVNALRVKATALPNLGRDTEAIATWEEAISLARQIAQDSALCALVQGDLTDQFRRLKRYADAVCTGRLVIATYHGIDDIRAWRYFDLSRDLRVLHCYEESVEAAQKSIMLYRRLAIRNPKKWMGDLAEGLSDLAHCLAAIDANSEAMIAWSKSASVINNFLDCPTGASPHSIERYCEALEIYRKMSLTFKNKEECLKVCSTALQYLYQLSEIYPQNQTMTSYLFRTRFYYAYNMIRFGCVQDAQEYVDVCISKPEPIMILEPEIASWHAQMVILKVNALDSQGSAQQALFATQKVRDILGTSVSDYQSCFSAMICAMVYEAQQQLNLSNNQEALQVAEKALELSWDNQLEPTVESLVWSLYGVAFTTLTCRNYESALNAAHEGCDVLASPENLEYWQDNHLIEGRTFILPNFFAFLSSAEANLGRCSTAIEHAYCAVDVLLEHEKMKTDISATAAEWSYMETRGNLAEILLATGDLAQARQICKERSTYFSKRVKTRMGEYHDLAPILRMLGVLCCSEGLHKEGEAAAQDLLRIMKTLGSTFLSLQDQVKIRLRNQSQVPILKVLGEMSQKLDCGHQMEVVSLFAI